MSFIVTDISDSSITVTVNQVTKPGSTFNKKLREVLLKQGNVIEKVSGDFNTNLVTYHFIKEISEEEAEEISEYINV